MRVRREPGLRGFTLRYANGAGIARPLTLVINGVEVHELVGAPTGGWSVWATLSADEVLNAGANSIELRAGPAGGPNVDKLTVQDV